MKRAIVTRADDNIAAMTKLSHPTIKAYADKCKADFVVLSKDWEGATDDLGKRHYRIFESAAMLLGDYDRVLSIDSDALVSSHCPDIFDVVPRMYIGSVFEDRGTRMQERHRRIARVQAEWGDVGWRYGYINTGVFVASREHADIFQSNNGNLWENYGYDDVHIGWMIRYLGHRVQELVYRFNHMSMFSEPWNGSVSRFDSFIIHYAGSGRFPDCPEIEGESGTNRIARLMEQDLKVWGSK